MPIASPRPAWIASPDGSGPNAPTVACPRHDTLEALLMASSRGDAEAFADLYGRMAPRMYGLVLRVVRDAHQSEEVTQEVFLQVWQTAGRFDPGRGSALSWLMTIAHRRAVDRVRHAEGWHRRSTADAERAREMPYDETVVAAHASMDGKEVRVALATLSPLQRQALELAYFGGCTHTEVSRILQIPLGTAKSRIRDGLLRLRAVLSPPAAEPA